MWMKRIFLFVLFLLPWQAALRAQEAPEGWQTSQYDMRSSGLSDNCVNDVLMDSRHLLWVATNAGLDLYDGSNIVNVPFPETESLVQPVVFSISEDPYGTVWAGTSKGLFYVDCARLRMRPFSAPELEGFALRQMCCSREGFLWIALKGRDLLRIDAGSGTVVSLPLKASAICCSEEGCVYILSTDGKIYFSADGVSEPECLIPDRSFDLEFSRISCAGDYLFLAAEKDASFAFDLRSRELISLPYIERIRDAVLTGSGESWIAARDGIHILDSSLRQLRIIRPFHDNYFRCLTHDGQGGIWAGLLLEGLAHFVPDKLQFQHFGASFAGGRFKARDFVETPDGSIWIGTDTKGILCLNPQDGKEHSARQYFPGRNVTGLMAEGNTLWVGTLDNDVPVTLLDTETGTMTGFPNAGNSAYAFCRDRSGRLWIGEQDCFIVGRDYPDGRFDREVFIPCAQVCRVICTSSGEVWVASISGQLFRYRDPVFSTYSISMSNILTDIVEDGDGHIFVASEGGGLWEFNPSLDCFEDLGIAEARLLKVSREQDGKLLWVTGAHGIHVINPLDGRKLPVIPIDAMEVDRFNYSSNFIASDGMLYAGTSDGFISFSAKKMRENSSAEQAPIISSIHTLSSSGDGQGGECYFHPISLNLGRKTRSFKVNVSMLDYGRFPLNEVFWKIDGINDWTPVDGGAFTVYDIPTGKWTLRVMALSLSGDESPESTISLTVQPPLMLSPLAFLLYFFFLVLLILGLLVLFNRHAKEKAARENERKLVASKMEFLTSIAHEIRTPLSLVQIPLEFLIRKFSTSPDGSVQENLDIMRRNSLKLTVLINELLDFRKLTDSTFQIHPEFLDIRTVLKDAHRRFHPMFLQEGKTLSLSVPDAAVYCETDLRSLGRIFDNLLSNALKYSAHRTAMSLTVSGQDAAVSVENDGAVLPDIVREEIFKPFYRYEDEASSRMEGTGLGLSTSRQFATLLGGSLSMDDDLSINRFIFTLPVSSHEETSLALPVVESKDKSVMVVEDDKDMARVIGGILSETYNIIYASNGKEAMERIKEGSSPTLVVSDVIMPEMDGISLTKALKGNLATSHIPVILLSAEVPDVFMQEGLEGGADSYLEKPFSPKKLRSTVDNLIENRRRIYDFYVSSLPSGGELPTGSVSAIEQKFLRSIQEFVSANLHRNITLDEMAEVVCLSSSSLYKKMKEYADISPMEYVMKMRLNKAVELLKDDSVSVQEVASAVGFNTHSFFSECFKREFGMTPRQWRVRNVVKINKSK